MYKKILFASDLSAFTSHALLHVESLANQYDAKISIVHAVRPLGEFVACVMKSCCSEKVKQEVVNLAHTDGVIEVIRSEIFDLFANNHYGEIDILSRVSDVVVAPGEPANVILRQAKELQADIIVLGSHGIGAPAQCPLGAVTYKVLQLAKAPVLMVPMMTGH